MSEEKTDDPEESIVIEFSGWLRSPAENLSFQYIGEDESVPGIIDGKAYLALSKEDRGKYVVENLGQAITQSDDLEYEEINVVVEEE